MRQASLLDQQIIALGRHQNAWQHCLELLHPTQGFQTGEFRHVHIQQGQMHYFRMYDVQSLFTIARQENAKTGRGKDAFQRLPKAQVVVAN